MGAAVRARRTAAITRRSCAVAARRLVLVDDAAGADDRACPLEDVPTCLDTAIGRICNYSLNAATQARIDDGVLRYHMVRGLVGEVIFAAGGVEREIEALRTAGQIAQAFADTHMPRPIPQPLMDRQ